ncbi:MAG: hypothetical protein JWP97_4590 [Labilithrix sp.]|nr:hypothetical protein [Labilithrix sp.]
MRFLVLMKPNDPTYEQGAMPTEAAIARMMKYNEELSKAGILLGLDGLHPSSKGARVTFAGGAATVTDGPFAETKELVGGYWIWKVKSKEEALAWVRRCPADDGNVIELRQIFDSEDFGPDFAARNDGFMAGVEKNRGA